MWAIGSDTSPGYLNADPEFTALKRRQGKEMIQWAIQKLQKDAAQAQLTHDALTHSLHTMYGEDHEGFQTAMTKLNALVKIDATKCKDSLKDGDSYKGLDDNQVNQTLKRVGRRRPENDGAPQGSSIQLNRPQENGPRNQAGPSKKRRRSKSPGPRNQRRSHSPGSAPQGLTRPQPRSQGQGSGPPRQKTSSNQRLNEDEWRMLNAMRMLMRK